MYFLVSRGFFAFVLPKLYKHKYLLSRLMRAPERNNGMCNGMNFEDKESYYDNVRNREGKNADEAKHDATTETV